MNHISNQPDIRSSRKAGSEIIFPIGQRISGQIMARTIWIDIRPSRKDGYWIMYTAGYQISGQIYDRQIYYIYIFLLYSLLFLFPTISAYSIPFYFYFQHSFRIFPLILSNIPAKRKLYLISINFPFLGREIQQDMYSSTKVPETSE